MAETDEQRLERLLIFGSCDGGIPDCAAANFRRQLIEHEGRTYWEAPRLVSGESLVGKVLDSQRRATMETYAAMVKAKGG